MLRKLKHLGNRLFIVAIGVYVLLIYIIQLVEAQAPDANIKSLSDVLWYSLVTLTTVGYGDYYPVTGIGKVLGAIIILSSVGILGYLIGGITNLIQSYMQKKKEGYYGTNYENHYIIIGWDDFSKKVTDQLIHAKKKVVIVTNKKEDIDLIDNLYEGYEVFTLFNDFRNYEGYEKANITKANKVFINIPDDTELLVFTINLRNLYRDINVIISLSQGDLKDTFHSIGVNHIISKNEIAAKMVASYIFEPDVATFTDDLITTTIQDTDYDIQQYRVVDGNPYKNSKYIDSYIELKTKYNSVLVGLVKKGELLKNPPSDTIIGETDYMLIISDGVSKNKLEKVFMIKEGVN